MTETLEEMVLANVLKSRKLPKPLPTDATELRRLQDMSLEVMGCLLEIKRLGSTVLGERGNKGQLEQDRALAWENTKQMTGINVIVRCMSPEEWRNAADGVLLLARGPTSGDGKKYRKGIDGLISAVQGLEQRVHRKLTEVLAGEESPPEEERSEGDGDKPPTPGGENATPTDDVLSERAQLVLQVLFKNGVFTSDERMTTEAIVAEGHGKDANAFKEVVSALREMGYVNTKPGRGGGVWLTETGKDRAAKL